MDELDELDELELEELELDDDAFEPLEDEDEEELLGSFSPPPQADSTKQQAATGKPNRKQRRILITNLFSIFLTPGYEYYFFTRDFRSNSGFPFFNIIGYRNPVFCELVFPPLILSLSASINHQLANATNCEASGATTNWHY